jgi:hypothetical protein
MPGEILTKKKKGSMRNKSSPLLDQWHELMVFTPEDGEE